MGIHLFFYGLVDPKDVLDIEGIQPNLWHQTVEIIP